MANILSWGKPKIEYVELVNGELPASPTWKAMPTPVENSTKLETEEGDTKEAKIEGGEVIATRKNASKYKLEFEIYETDDLVVPIPDEDGIILKQYAFRLSPENSSAKGFIMDKTSVSSVRTWDSEVGGKIKYTANALKPKTGKMLKEYNG
ncbi:hypothetical protein RCZ04_04430 [Capnocytophaga sp. HP1101]